MNHTDVVSALRKVATAARAKSSAWFFKTNPGDYGHGDQFIGVTVPDERTIAKKFRMLPLDQIRHLVKSPIHEVRQTGLMILAYQFAKADSGGRGQIYEFYVSHLQWVNNWDLVDGSAGAIMGEYLLDRDTAVLKKLAKSESLWERRIAMIATLAFIRKDQFAVPLSIAEILVTDKEDLIQKAVGWMLREIGKRSHEAEEAFLKKYYRAMPRTMLRYAIERFGEPLRKQYLKGEIGDR